MPAKITTEEHYNRIKQRIADAPRGADGLKRIRWFDFKEMPAHRLDEFITEPIVITADGEDQVVGMSLDDYKCLMFKGFTGERVRIQGKLFGEIK